MLAPPLPAKTLARLYWARFLQKFSFVELGMGSKILYPIWTGLGMGFNVPDPGTRPDPDTRPDQDTLYIVLPFISL